MDLLGGDQDPASASLPPMALALAKTILPFFSNKEVAIKVGTKFKVDLERQKGTRLDLDSLLPLLPL
jgi:hypothetical protein